MNIFIIQRLKCIFAVEIFFLYDVSRNILHSMPSSLHFDFGCKFDITSHQGKNYAKTGVLMYNNFRK